MERKNRLAVTLELKEKYSGEFSGFSFYLTYLRLET